MTRIMSLILLFALASACGPSLQDQRQASFLADLASAANYQTGAYTYGTERVRYFAVTGTTAFAFANCETTYKQAVQHLTQKNLTLTLAGNKQRQPLIQAQKFLVIGFYNETAKKGEWTCVEARASGAVTKYFRNDKRDASTSSKAWLERKSLISPAARLTVGFTTKECRGYVHYRLEAVTRATP